MVCPSHLAICVTLVQSTPLLYEYEYTALYSWQPWQTGVAQLSIFVDEIAAFLVGLSQDFLVDPRFHHGRTSRDQHCLPSAASDDGQFGSIYALGFFAGVAININMTRSATVCDQPEDLEAYLRSSVLATCLGATTGVLCLYLDYAIFTSSISACTTLGWIPDWIQHPDRHARPLQRISHYGFLSQPCCPSR